MYVCNSCIPLEFILKDSRRSMPMWHMIMCISVRHLGQAPFLRITGSAASLTSTCRTHFILSEFTFVKALLPRVTSMFREHYLIWGLYPCIKITGMLHHKPPSRRGPGRSGKPSHRRKLSAAVHQWFTGFTTTTIALKEERRTA